ncbi:MAG: flavodoxin-dependent (E)-4-hydroxy-3-methylbut-2-enyl-diphosphate synthase [Clostridia bacterium]|nr:flavodoxin-dependent (E)-4-hydroxy-3-methylbut-2-enyl-diphosphate synthase [Clostridia bacterium]
MGGVSGVTGDGNVDILLAHDILAALNLDTRRRMNIISCPTCGRMQIDLIALVRTFEDAAGKAGLLQKDVKVALMGCAVNSPGEALEADIGIASGIGEAVLIKKGEVVEKIREEDIIPRLIKEIKKM